MPAPTGSEGDREAAFGCTGPPGYLRCLKDAIDSVRARLSPEVIERFDARGEASVHYDHLPEDVGRGMSWRRSLEYALEHAPALPVRRRAAVCLAAWSLISGAVAREAEMVAGYVLNPEGTYVPRAGFKPVWRFVRACTGGGGLEDPTRDLEAALVAADPPPREHAGAQGDSAGQAPSDSGSLGGTEDSTTHLRRPLKPCEEKAYSQVVFATDQEPGLSTDREFFDWLQSKPDFADELPQSFNTWRRYVRAGRKYHGTQKHTPRAGRQRGKGIVREEDV